MRRNLDRDLRPQLTEDIYIRPYRHFFLAASSKCNSVIGINDAAAELLKNCDGGRSLSEIIKSIAKRRDLHMSVSDSMDFFKELAELEWIEFLPSKGGKQCRRPPSSQS